MKVYELINKLASLDPGMEVKIKYYAEPNTQSNGGGGGAE